MEKRRYKLSKSDTHENEVRGYAAEQKKIKTSIVVSQPKLIAFRVSPGDSQNADILPKASSQSRPDLGSQIIASCRGA